MSTLSRRQFLAAALGGAGAVATGGLLVDQAWPLLVREDLVPGRAPTLDLPAEAWTVSDDALTFAAIGDNGSGGRQAMAVAERMAETYRVDPFGLVVLLGDICYYGKIRDRFHDVFVRPMTPLVDAGVRFELAIGNHDGRLYYSDETLAEVEDTLELLGTPARYYTTTNGPVDFFYLDTGRPGVFGLESRVQLEWLDDALASSTNQGKVGTMPPPPFSSGRHGSTPGLADVLQPVLARHAVDLVLAGHDHHYERTVPIDGTTYVVSGGGCKTTAVDPQPFTTVAERTLEFLHAEVDGDRLTARAIRPDGSLVDRFELRAREGR